MTRKILQIIGILFSIIAILLILFVIIVKVFNLPIGTIFNK